MTLPDAVPLRIISEEELATILAKHEKYVRGEMGGVRADLSATNLIEKDLTGANLFGADLHDSLLRNAKLTKANLSAANLYGCDLRGAVLIEADLSKADLRGALLRHTLMNGANLSEADLRDGRRIERDDKPEDADGSSHEEDGLDVLMQNKPADVSSAMLVAANLAGARMGRLIAMQTDFSGASLKGVRLVEANLRGAKLLNADLSGADLSHSDLRGATLFGAVLASAVLEDCKIDESPRALGAIDEASPPTPQATSALPKQIQALLASHRLWANSHGTQGKMASLSGLDLRACRGLPAARLTCVQAERTNFSGLQMEQAELQAACVAGSQFVETQLMRSDLRGIKAQHADFSGAILTGSDLGCLKVGSGKTVVPQLTECSFRQAILDSVNLVGANLQKSDFTGASLKDADLRDADLRGVIFDATDLDGALIEGALLGPLFE